jgi:hypothetical protein
MNETPQPERRHYEPDTISPRKVLSVLAAAAVVSLILVGVAWGINEVSLSRERPDGGFPERYIERPADVPPIRSVLIDKSAVGLARKRREIEILHSYGWVDPQRRIVRIPIDQAMDLIAVGEALPDPPTKGKQP